MKPFDFLLTLLLPSVILLHLLVAPYTKVEESFSLQSAHDILVYSTPTSNIGSRLRTTYDHFEFPGAVPRTFVGAVALAGVSGPLISFLGQQYAQLIVRGVLGLLNAFALLRYKDGLDKAFGTAVGRWYILLQASQFHVMYYASRTLPNMFAFGLSTLALREVLPMPALATKGSVDITTKRQRLMIYLLVLAGVIFRSELALLLASQLFYLLVMPSISLGTIIPTGVCSATIALAISVPIDSYFWQRPIWPELAGFVYNVIQGKSADWGTSPIHAYFGNFLPKILLNPVILLFLIPYAVFHSNPAMRRPARGLVIPSLLFISIYSLQPHKEARFIIYTVPPLTACAAVAANYIFSRRSRTLIYAILSLGIMASIVLSFGASTLMLAISSLNYPGGEALYRLHQIAAEDKPGARTVNVHMDVLSCMTGVSRFEQDFPTPPFIAQLLSSLQPRDSDYTQTVPLSTRLKFRYDKTENATALLDPSFWTQFDYVLAEEPERVIGSWEIVDTIYGYAGIEVLRPGMASASGVDNKHYAAKVWDEMAEIGGAEESMQEQRHRQIAQGMELSARLREGVREKITRGWWIGPKLEAKIRVLRRVP